MSEISPPDTQATASVLEERAGCFYCVATVILGVPSLWALTATTVMVLAMPSTLGNPPAELLGGFFSVVFLSFPITFLAALTVSWLERYHCFWRYAWCHTVPLYMMLDVVFVVLRWFIEMNS